MGAMVNGGSWLAELTGKDVSSVGTPLSPIPSALGLSHPREAQVRSLDTATCQVRHMSWWSLMEQLYCSGSLMSKSQFLIILVLSFLSLLTL